MIHYSEYNSGDNEEKLPWGFFLFLFIIFYFTTPYDLIFTIREPITAQSIIMHTDKGDLGRRISLFMLGLFGMFNIAQTSKADIKIDFLALLVISYIFLALVSVSWSDETILTFRKIVVLAMLWVGAAGIAIRYSIRDICFFTLFSGFVTITLGVICEVYLGTFRPFDIPYRFAGTLYPNTQGLNCSMLAIASYSLSKTEMKWKSVFNMLTFVALIFLFLTKSRASYVGALSAIGAYWVITSSRDRKLAFLIITIILICILGLFLGDAIFAFINRATYVGRNASDLNTLAMRIPLWQECMRFLTQQPIQGFGYESFWTARRVSEFSRQQGWAVAQCHSGYIQLALDLGIVGLLLFLSMLFIGAKRALLTYSLTKDCAYMFCVSIILCFCVDMLFENINVLPYLSNFLCIIMILKMSFLNIESIGSMKSALNVNGRRRE